MVIKINWTINLTIAVFREGIKGFSAWLLLNKSQICMGKNESINAEKPRAPYFLYRGISKAIPIVNSATIAYVCAIQSGIKSGIMAAYASGLTEWL